MRYTIELLQGNMKIRKDHGVQKNGVDIDSIATLTANTYAEGIETWEPAYEGEYLNAIGGDLWLHLVKPTNGWIAIRHAGKTYCDLVELPDVPPLGNFPDRVRWTDLETGEYADYVKVIS